MEVSGDEWDGVEVVPNARGTPRWHSRVRASEPLASRILSFTGKTSQKYERQEKRIHTMTGVV